MFDFVDLPLAFLGLRRLHQNDDDDEHSRGCLLLIAAIVLVCVTAFLSWREIVYLCRGQTTDAAVLRVFDVEMRRSAHTTVQFEFTDPSTNTQRLHSDDMHLGWRPPDGPLRVEFVPGADAYARVAGYTQRWSLWVFGASVTAATAYIVMLAREANTPIRRQRRYNRKSLH